MHTVDKSGAGEVFVIPAPFDFGQGRGAQTTFLLSHGITLGAVVEPDQDGGTGSEEPVCPETHSAGTEVHHLGVMMVGGIELAADDRSRIIKTRC
jgi:hypothetical protein